VLKREVRSVLLNQDLIPDVSLDSKRTVKVVQKEAKRAGAQPFEQKRRQLEQRTVTPAAPEKKPSMVAETMPAWTDLPQKQTAVAAVEEPAIQTADSAIKEPAIQTADAAIKEPAMQTADAVVKEPVIQTAESVAKEPTIPTVNAVTVAKEPANPSLQPPAGKTTPAPQQLTFADEGFLAQAARPKHRLIGQLFQTYWLIEYDKKLFIMDQHAAHEKVNYERFMKHRKEKSKRYVQQVSPPIVVTMTPKEAAAYEEYKDYFAEFGFEISDFGDSEYAIHGVPTDLYGIADKDAFIGLLDEIVENVHGTQADMIAGKIATMACKASVKGGQRLSFEEAEQLIDELLTLDSPFTCPHGRPTIISMTQTEIEKKFKRIQDR
jgi:DNA mismatch repair protein MutL